MSMRVVRAVGLSVLAWALIGMPAIASAQTPDSPQALKQQIGNNQKVADAENEAKVFKSLSPASDEKGPVAEAQRKIAKGDFILVPEGTPHWFSTIDGTLTLMSLHLPRTK